MKQFNFEKLVKEAVMALPKHIRKKMQNLAIVIKERPSPADLEKAGTRIGGLLLGFYQGIPKTTWGRNSVPRLPDKITIFQKPIEALANSQQKEMLEIVKVVVWHEIAHHFGLSERRIRQLETKWKKNLNRQNTRKM